ncbi:putative disease resistance protein RGA1 [Cornus florida]|uniref:putative disease resistance protein RGA1 n=1 Tax=Cornus florida TaxID=4283 RepID=UPI00289CF46B|nr:putative disease resistance protein RGA1 [Cornus florida]
MADLILSPLLQVLIDKLASPFLEKLCDLYHFRENIGRLQDSLPMVQAFLEDAEDRQVTEKAVKVWLLKLKDKVCETEDLLEVITAEITLCESRSSIRTKVHKFLLPFEPSRRFFEFASELQNKLKLLDKIAKKGQSFNLREGIVNRQTENLGRRRPTGSFVIKSEVYGREKDKEEILKLLLPICKEKLKGDVSVIPIVGIGGLGKTTLARLLYNDEKVTQYFDLKIWVYVSEDFDPRKIILSIVESATKKKCKFLEMDLLQSLLQESLCGKRVLLVLDDVWNEDQGEWNELGDLLRSCMEGSKVIVTTRSKKVASIMGTTFPHRLKGLHEDDCWLLFKKRAFGHGEEEEHPDLLPIGKKIIKKCGGVPLAAQTLGSLLRFKREMKDWLFVQESELWNHEECQTGILPALRLSYIYLPSHLKRCFVYCSLFPKNYEINREKLIHLWMAAGLILSFGGSRVLEDIGDEYFNDFLCLSFFQEVEKSEDGSIKVYQMHDVIHDLARYVAGNEFVIIGHGLAPSNLAQTRHSSIDYSVYPSSFPHGLFKATHLRTLLFLCPGDHFEELPSSLTAMFVYLRVLDLSQCGIKTVQKSINELMCLRYLDLSNSSIQTLPHTICDLCNLQTLNLSGCNNLVELPLGMGKLISLRHLNIMGCERLSRMPYGIGKLVHLQTLPIYVVGKETGESIAELNCLNVRGDLNIKCLENVKDSEEAKEANLRGKRYLHMLALHWGNNVEGHNLKAANRTTSHEVKNNKHAVSSGSSHGENSNARMREVEEILRCLQPHPNLKKLFIKGYPGIKFPYWVLPSLVVVTLINCKRCESLPTLGHLAFLKTLYLQEMDGVTHIAEEFYSGDTEKPFPSLKELTLKYFPNLEKWSCIDDKQAFPCLEKLIVDACPKLTTAPVIPSLQHLELRDCHPEILNSIKSITYISVLVIDTFPELQHLPGEFLENNTRLEYLEICSCQNLHALPSEIENAIALKSLIVSCCEELSSLPHGLQKLKGLELLDINGCHKIKFLPEDGIGGLRSLQTLSIENCNKLISLSSGLRHLTALQQLTIMSCPELDSLPHGLQNLSALRSLSIVSCPELSSLPESLQYVTKLQTLVIHSCPGLTVLPDWIANFSSLRSLAITNCHYLISLPEGLQHLGTLQHLSVQDCPGIERRYKQMGGKEWHKIAHIPHLYIGTPEFGK